MSLKLYISCIFVLLCSFNLAMAETQSQLNQTACAELQQADSQLNQTYQKILAHYKKDAAFISRFIAAQKKWIEFRDAYLASMYVPEYKDSYGSVLPMCQCYFIERLTSERTKQLQVWIEGIEEGDVCTGSVNP